MRRRLLTASFVVCLASTALGGVIYKVTCKDDKCGFTSSISVGGILKANRASGYCTTCKQFVKVEWPRQLPGKPVQPAPVAGEIWDGVSGRTIRLFHCPHCRRPFAEIKGIEELKHCPKCSNASPVTTREGTED